MWADAFGVPAPPRVRRGATQLDRRPAVHLGDFDRASRSEPVVRIVRDRIWVSPDGRGMLGTRPRHAPEDRAWLAGRGRNRNPVRVARVPFARSGGPRRGEGVLGADLASGGDRGGYAHRGSSPRGARVRAAGDRHARGVRLEDERTAWTRDRHVHRCATGGRASAARPGTRTDAGLSGTVRRSRGIIGGGPRVRRHATQ